MRSRSRPAGDTADRAALSCLLRAYPLNGHGAQLSAKRWLRWQRRNPYLLKALSGYLAKPASTCISTANRSGQLSQLLSGITHSVATRFLKSGLATANSHSLVVRFSPKKPRTSLRWSAESPPSFCSAPLSTPATGQYSLRPLAFPLPRTMRAVGSGGRSSHFRKGSEKWGIPLMRTGCVGAQGKDGRKHNPRYELEQQYSLNHLRTALRPAMNMMTMIPTVIQIESARARLSAIAVSAISFPPAGVLRP